MLRILGFSLAVPMLVRLPLPRVERVTTPRRARASGGRKERAAKIVASVDGVLQAGRPLTRHDCLTRGLTAYRFLRREGIEAVLCFGVRVEPDGAVGHCWLVMDGEPLFEQADPRRLYQETCRFPTARVD